MNPIEAFDHWLITAAYEPFSWRMERHWGTNCFTLARGSFILGLIWWTAYIFAMSPAALSFLLFPLIGMLFFFWVLINHVESGVLARPTHLNHWKNSWRLRFPTLCAVFFIIFDDYWRGQPLLQFLVGETLPHLLLLSTLYFIACNPMPPRWEPEKRVWLEGLPKEI